VDRPERRPHPRVLAEAPRRLPEDGARVSERRLGEKTVRHAATLLVLAAAAPLAAAAGGTLRWGGDAEGGAPFVEADPADPARVRGFDVEIAEALAKGLGRTPQFVQVAYQSIDQSAQRGDFDIGLSGMEDTRARRAALSVTLPYFEFREVLAVRAPDGGRFRKLADFRGRRVGTLSGTIAYEILLKAGAESGVLPVSYDDDVHPYEDLARGRLDAVLLDHVLAARSLRRVPGLAILPETVVTGHYVGVLAKENAALRDIVDRLLGEMMRDGTLRKIFERWNVWDESQARFQSDALAQRGVRREPNTEISSNGKEAGAAVGALRAGGEAPATLPGISSNGKSREPAAAAPRAGDSAAGAAASPSSLSEKSSSPSSSSLSLVLSYLPSLFRAALVTIVLSCVAMGLAVALGIGIASGRIYGGRLARAALTGYVELVRGTPVLLQLFVLYYGLSSVVRLPAFVAALLGLGLNYAAYESEIYRGALEAVPRGQLEAARTLGLTEGQVLRLVRGPQAFRLALAPMTNDFVALLKDSSLVSVVTVVELTKQTAIFATNVGSWALPGALCAALYLAMSLPLSRLARRLEKRWNAPSA
jgi:polar amino acid transport system substrate-binding protein